MSQILESDTVTVPRSVLADIARLSPAELRRMHHLLEKNTEGVLESGDVKELEYLVRLTQIDQIIGTLLRATKKP